MSNCPCNKVSEPRCLEIRAVENGFIIFNPEAGSMGMSNSGHYPVKKWVAPSTSELGKIVMELMGGDEQSQANPK